MPEQVVKTLILPFEKGMLKRPEPGRAFYMRAETDGALQNEWREILVCEQTYKPMFDRLVAAGFKTVTRLEGEYDMGFCLLTIHKSESLANIGRAWKLLGSGGVLVCAGAKKVGVSSVERLVDNYLGVECGLPKHHCRVFWCNKTEKNSLAVPDEWHELDRLSANVDGTFLTKPGIFSWDKVDDGSRLLVESIPEELTGDVADLGAGWGYLSIQILKHYTGIRSLDLYEAELLAIEAARENIANIETTTRISYTWHDVTEGLPKNRYYDWIIMNPPFHRGKITDVGLGHAFIDAAAKSIKKRGKLILVANRKLPYEFTLRQRFAAVQIVTEAKGYKVILAQL